MSISLKTSFFGKKILGSQVVIFSNRYEAKEEEISSVTLAGVVDELCKVIPPSEIPDP